MMMALLILTLAHAAFIDSMGPTDIAGRPQVDLYDLSGNQRGTQTNPLYVNEPLDTTSATIAITAADVASTTVTQFSGQTSTSGTPTTGSSAVMALGSVQTSMIIVTGTWTGTLQVEVSSDGGVTYQPRAMHVLGSPIFAATVTGNVVGSINATAKTHVRMRAVSTITGTAQIRFVGSANQSNVYIGNALKLVDGSATSLPAPQLAIKAASTPAVASDPAAVVTISPNTSITVDARAWSSRTIIGNGTTVIKTGSGILHGFVINNNATGGVLYLYDNTAGSGTIAATGNAGTPSGGVLSGSGNPGAQFVGDLDIAFTNGITAVTSGSTVNSFTVIYR
jgi:hypothetical protein